MPPNSIDLTPVQIISQDIISNDKPKESLPGPRVTRYEENYGLMIFQSGLNLLAHILIGMVVTACFLFVFRGGLVLAATPPHIILCVTGYIILMAQGILSLSNENGWTTKFKLVDKRRAHWILQIVGSVLAIAGSFIMTVSKDVHWNTLHGRFGLVALVFTTVSLINGLSSLWAYELRRFLPGNVSKISHICFGIVAFSAACISLCYGMNKGSFRRWASDALANTFIGFVAVLLLIVIVNPLISFFNKAKRFANK